METVVAASALQKTYGQGESEVHALAGVDVQVHAGQFVAIMGPSGSGKSTLMQCLAGLDSVDSGEITIGGINITHLGDRELTRLRREHIGFIFQQFNLVPTLTAEQNITLPLKLAKRPLDEKLFNQVAQKLGIGHRLEHKPHEMSGGQQQRVAIARALIARPTVIFADEPTGNLDSHSSSDVLRILRDSVDSFEQIVIMVTHDPIAATYADEVIMLADGQIKTILTAPSVEQIMTTLKDVELKVGV